jgi:acetyl-CoA carboxylase biotin carboxyl carrier protein
MTEESSARAAADAELFRSVCQETHALLAKVGGSVQRLAVRAGAHSIVVEWAPAQVTGASPAPPSAAATPGAEPQVRASGTGEPVAAGRQAVVAPLVGTFYRCPEPGAKPFVDVGDVVEAGQEVGIVEAMKIMNRIVADQPGRVAEFAVADGEMVEFAQVIMYLDPLDPALPAVPCSGRS